MALERPPVTTIEATHGLRIDLTTQTVAVDDQVVPLTPREWRLLAHLAETPDRWCHADQIGQAIWGAATAKPLRVKSVRITMQRLRIKLGHAHAAILTRVGFGYQLRTDTTTPLPNPRLPEPPKRRGWARGFDACQWCKRTDRPHKSRGLCARCYDRQRLAGKWI